MSDDLGAGTPFLALGREWGCTLGQPAGDVQARNLMLDSRFVPGEERVPLLFGSLMAENAAPFCRALCTYLGRRLGVPVDSADELSWQERERLLYRGEAHLGVVCGLQYVYSQDRGDRPGVELLAAPVMRGTRYRGRPVYFSDVVVRRDSPARSMDDLRGAAWAYNEPTSQSGYGIVRYALAEHGGPDAFCSSWIESGAHQQSLQLILAGAVDAAAIDSTVLEQELRARPWLADRLRVAATLGPSPIPPVVAARLLPEPLRAAIRETLLTMHRDAEGAAVLDGAAIARFVAIADADYEPIRQMAAPWTRTRAE